MTLDLNALELLNKARTPGEWEVEAEGDTEGGHGRYTSYSLRGSLLSRDYDILADSINSTASEMHDDWDEDGGHRWDEVARRNFEFIAAAANSMAELIRLARIGQREERHRQDIVDCAIKGLFPEQAADLLRLHEHFSDTIAEAPKALITRMADLGFVERIGMGRWEFNDLGEGVVKTLKAQRHNCPATATPPEKT